MDIRRISGPWNAHAWLAVSPPITQPVHGPRPIAPVAPAQAAGDRNPGDAESRRDTVHSTMQTLKETLLRPDAVKVAVHRRPDGVTLVTLYDTRSGDVIAQMRPEGVIDAVDAAMKLSELKAQERRNVTS